MELSNTVTKESSNSLTVSIFLEICILQRKMGKTWNNVTEHINDVYMVTIKPLKIYNPYQNAPFFQNTQYRNAHILCQPSISLLVILSIDRSHCKT